MAAVTRRGGKLYIIMESRNPGEESAERETVAVDDCGGADVGVVKFKIDIDFTDMKDETVFYYYNYSEEKFIQIGGKHKLHFALDHFTGCRFGLFMYATRQIGGKAAFMGFRFNTQ